MKIVIRNAKQIVNYRDFNILKGEELNNLPLLHNKDIVIKDGIIEFIGDTGGDKGDITIDATGKTVMPGFVDAHTHLVFGGKRYDEFEERARGVPYMEIAKKGGGILRTVKDTRKASFEELKSNAKLWIKKMIASGTTTFEVKSGYGLDTETEMKMLDVIDDLKKEYNIVSTFLGAHEIPLEYKNDKEKYIEIVTGEMLDEAVKRDVKFIDVFCEDAIFNKEDSQYILKKGKGKGLIPRIHAEEIGYTGGAKMVAEMQGASADHLLLLKEEDMKVMAENNTCAVILPGTSFILRKNYAPVRKIIDNKVITVLATDFNPGSCPIYRMDIVIGIGMLYAGFTLNEAINSATLNAAYLLGYKDRGVIKEGYKGDIVIYDMEDYREMPYWFGRNSVLYTILNGTVYKHGEKYE